MATGRMLKRNISDSRRLSELETDSARMLWTWIIPFLDVEGRFYAAPDMIKGKVVPRLKTFTEKNISEYLQDMAKVGLIVLYQHDGDDYLQYRNFKEFQTLQPKKEGKPLPAPNEKETTPRQLRDNSETTPTQFNITKVNLKEAKGTPEELLPVDNSPAEEKPTDEKTAFLKELKTAIEGTKTRHNSVHEQLEIANWIKQHLRTGNPNAIIHCINQLSKAPEKVKKLTSYLDAAFKIEEGKYNAADSERRCNEYKNQGIPEAAAVFLNGLIKSMPSTAH